LFLLLCQLDCASSARHVPATVWLRFPHRHPKAASSSLLDSKSQAHPPFGPLPLSFLPLFTTVFLLLTNSASGWDKSVLLTSSPSDLFSSSLPLANGPAQKLSRLAASFRHHRTAPTRNN
jgi:hypothetical protein